MPTKKRDASLFDAQKFAGSLAGLLDALPSEANRKETVSQLQQLIEFLGNLKSRLECIPTQQDALAARAAVDRLSALFSEAKSNPALGIAVGIKATPSSRKAPTITTEEIEHSKLAIARFESLPIDEIRVALERMPTRNLQAVASALGIRTTQRTGRDSLVHQVATKITNTRGYRSLRDGTDEH